MIFRKEQPIPEEAVSLREQRAMQGDRLSFAASEAYKLLRTNLTFPCRMMKKCRVVGVTSASAARARARRPSTLPIRSPKQARRSC